MTSQIMQRGTDPKADAINATLIETGKYRKVTHMELRDGPRMTTRILMVLGLILATLPEAFASGEIEKAHKEAWKHIKLMPFYETHRNALGRAAYTVAKQSGNLDFTEFKNDFKGTTDYLKGDFEGLLGQYGIQLENFDEYLRSFVNTLCESLEKFSTIKGVQTFLNTKNNSTAIKVKQSRVIQGYTILKTLGSGEWGKVNLAKKEGEETKYAIKELYMKGANVIENGKKEARIQREVSGIEHPYVARFVESFQHEDTYYIVLEFCGGGDLMRLRQIQGTLTEEQLLYYTNQTMKALKHMHGKGYAWLDLKVENILLNEKGVMKITDFGVSEKFVNGKARTKLLNVVATTAADYHCLGKMLYRMLTGMHVVSADLKQASRLHGSLRKHGVSKNWREFVVALLSLDVSKPLPETQIASLWKNVQISKAKTAINKLLQTPPFCPRIVDGRVVGYEQMLKGAQNEVRANREATRLMQIGAAICVGPSRRRTRSRSPTASPTNHQGKQSRARQRRHNVGRGGVPKKQKRSNARVPRRMPRPRRSRYGGRRL